MVSSDGVAPSRMVDVSASVNLPLHHKIQKFSSGTGSPEWSRKKGRKTVVVLTKIKIVVTTISVSCLSEQQSDCMYPGAHPVPAPGS